MTEPEDAAPDSIDSDAAETGEDLAPTPEQRAARRDKANRATRGALAAVLCLEAFVVLLVPRAIAQTSVGLSGTKTALLVALAIVLIATGFMLRRPWGIGLASVLQIVLLSTIVLVPAIAIVQVVFLGVWYYILTTRHQLVDTPSGWRMLIS